MIISKETMFDDGSAAAKALTVNLAAGSGTTTFFPAGSANTLLLCWTGSGTAATSIDLAIDVSSDGGTTSYPLAAVNFVSGGVTDTDDLVFQGPGTAANHTVAAPIYPGLHYRVRAKRTGGAADTAAIVYGVFVRA